MGRDKVREEKDRKEVLAAFDIENDKLPDRIAEAALPSGGYPHDKKLKRGDFEAQMEPLQVELVKMQRHVQKTGERILVIFEGRDAAGKGTCIKYFTENLNPRGARIVALSKPTEIERGQWYFQRYLAHLPSAGNIVLFDLSWYNRAGVERVMGFANADQTADFLRDAPEVEELLVRDGIRLFKIYLEIGQEMQILRFHERRHDPVKQWKITDIDIAAMSRFEDYTKAKEDMFRFTNTVAAPWTVILANDQRRARIAAIRLILSAIDYEGKNSDAIGERDALIVGTGPAFFCRPA
jgi:polyphosphate kinase 2